MTAPDDPTTAHAPPTGSGAGTQVQTEPPTHLFADTLPAVPGYAVAREIASGGMGVVYRARDAAFDRDVAVKVMRHGQDAGRFVVEARVTGQLAHPGVPPVYALGTLPDGRPFLVMKLVHGFTLAKVIKTVRRPNLLRALSAFEGICQTVGFAHSKGIVHRDLKPSNVMIGSFGEVLVMDWGLARESRGAEPAAPNEDRNTTAAPSSTPGSAPRAPRAEETVAGEVKGTPAYMAPEQARGEPVDARADVFALGGILAALLTGKPPFEGTTVLDTVLKAAMAEVQACFAALDACRADPELVAIAKRCLAPAAADRFADGKELAAAVAAHRAGLERRLRRAQRERAAAEARAAEEVNTRREAEARAAAQKKARRLRLALAAVVGVMALAGGAVGWYLDHGAAERRASEARLAGERDAEARLKADQAQGGTRTALELAADLRRQYKFAAAGTALAQAAALAAGGAPELVPAVEQARADLKLVVNLDDIRCRTWLWSAVGNGRGEFDTRFVSGASRAAFASAGLNPDAPDPAGPAARIAASAVKAELVAALDTWAVWERDPAVRARVLAVARRADPGPWTDRLRDPAVYADKAAVAKLAADLDPAATPPAAVAVLAALMRHHGLSSVAVLSAARTRHPTDFVLAMALGQAYVGVDPAGKESGPLDAARALRPDNLVPWVSVALAQAGRGETDAALATYRRALEIDPTNALVHNNLGLVLQDKGDLDGALAAHRRALELDPKYAIAQNSVGIVLGKKGDPAGAMAAYRRALEIDPANAMAHYNVGVRLGEAGDVAGAIAAYRESVRHDPTFAMAHYNLGNKVKDTGDLKEAAARYRRAVELDPKFAMAFNNLGWVLNDLGDLDAAIAALERAVALDPALAVAHTNLGWALCNTGDLDGAVVAHRRAIRLDPRLDLAHFNLGLALAERGDTAGAIAAYKRAVELNPKYPEALNNLGELLHDKGDLDAAIAAFRRAIASKPDLAVAHMNLGRVLSDKGDVPGALAALNRAIELDPKFARAHYNLGLVLNAKGDADGAAAAYTRAIAADPALAYAHINLGVIRHDQKRFAEAAACARAAIQVAPRNADAHALLGFALRDAGDAAGARAAFGQAARLDPKKWGPEFAKLPPVPVAPPPRAIDR